MDATADRRRGRPITRRRFNLWRRETLWFYLLVLPWILGFLIFQLGPILAALYFSFTDMSDLDLTHLPHWVGLDHYRKLFGSLAFLQFRESMRVTAIYVLGSVPAVTISALLVAQLLNQKIPFLRFLRTAYFLPVVVTGVVAAQMWQWLLQPDNGLLDGALSSLGLGRPDWLNDPNLAMAALILYQCWYLGGPMVMFLAGLQGVPAELYEAAAIDGAGSIRRFLSIAIPMISPLILLAAVLGVIGYLQDYLGPAILTGGGPMNATWVLSLEIYNNAVDYTYPGHMAAACAEAMLLFLTALALTFAVFLGARRFVYYAGDRESRL